MPAKNNRNWWNPRPPEPPQVDERFADLPALPRAAEAIRFFLARLERWLSAGGVLREWVRLNVLVAVVCGTGVLLAVPVVTALLSGVADWSALISLAVGNLIGIAVALPPLVLAIATGFLLWRLGKRNWLRRRPNRNRQLDEDNEYYR